MIDRTALDLLREALDLFNDAPRFALRRDPSQSSYALASRVEAYLAKSETAAAPDVVAGTRAGWRSDGRIRIADAPSMRLDRDGMWIGAWVLAGSGDAGVEAITAERLERALAAVSLMAREVFRLHRDSGLDYAAIGRRLAIGIEDVQRHMVEALVQIDVALGNV